MFSLLIHDNYDEAFVKFKHLIPTTLTPHMKKLPFVLNIVI